MKLLQVATLSAHRLLMLSLVTIAAVSSSLFVPSSQALTATTNFVCAKSDGKPATIARTKKGDVTLVIWSSEGFSEAGFTPQVRCQQVSARFQSMYRSGQLKFIAAGILNKLVLSCVNNPMIKEELFQ